MSIPFGAIVYDATALPQQNGHQVMVVRFSRRARDGSYGKEEITMVRSPAAQKLVAAALERGEGGFWGGWFGLPGLSKPA